jgi:hypothetical protein
MIQRTESKSEQRNAENRSKKRAERTREQPFAASKTDKRTGGKSEQIRIENRYIKRAESDLLPVLKDGAFSRNVICVACSLNGLTCRLFHNNDTVGRDLLHSIVTGRSHILCRVFPNTRPKPSTCYSEAINHGDSVTHNCRIYFNVLLRIFA